MTLSYQLCILNKTTLFCMPSLYAILFMTACLFTTHLVGLLRRERKRERALNAGVSAMLGL